MKSFTIMLLVVLASCTDNDAAPDAGHVTAAQVSYDNATSSPALGAHNVQDAIDELDTALGAVEARPVAELPLAQRTELIEQTFPNPGTTAVDLTASCPQPATDMILGGACRPPGGAEVLLGSSIQFGPTIAGYNCVWSQPAGNTDPLHIQVMCAHNAR